MTDDKPEPGPPPLPPEHAHEDYLSPGAELRKLAQESRTERVGDGTPIGPETSPPVESEGAPPPSGASRA